MADQEAARALARAVGGSELVAFDDETDLVYAWNGAQTINVIDLDGTTVDMWMMESADGLDVARQQIRDRIAAGWPV